MPKITFLPEGSEVEVPEGTSLLEAAGKLGVRAPVGSACGGVLACSTCHCYVKEGYDSLEPVEDGEDDILDKAFDVRPTSRLGCQARIQDQDLVVEISRESRQTYFNEHPEAKAS